METIHVKFDELTAMAFEHNCLEPDINRFNNDDLSSEFTSTTSKEDLDNLFSPITNFSISSDDAVESVQEDSADLDGNTLTSDWDPSKPVMMRSRLYTDLEVCMYALNMSIIEPKNIKEAMSDHSWIESMQDELHQLQKLDAWELVS
ncbi:hypothetical protein Tco_0396177 [Tanacetum coccineum]